MKRLLITLSLLMSIAIASDNSFQKQLDEYNEKKNEVYTILVTAQEKLATSTQVLNDYENDVDMQSAIALRRELNKLSNQSDEIIGSPLGSPFASCYATIQMLSNQYGARFDMVYDIYNARKNGKDDMGTLNKIGRLHENWMSYRDQYDKNLPACLREIFESPKDEYKGVVITPSK